MILAGLSGLCRLHRQLRVHFAPVCHPAKENSFAVALASDHAKPDRGLADFKRQ